MCLALFALDPDGEYPLILAANRDEFLDRPTAPAAWWDEPEVLAGRDLQAGGTWLAVNRAGRIAWLTNVRDQVPAPTDPPSRGQLPLKALGDDIGSWLERYGASYAGFNLLYGDARGLSWYSNRGGRVEAVLPGVHGISNGALDEPWPKVVRGRSGLADILRDGSPYTDRLLDLLTHAEPAEKSLPDTGVGPDMERFLSPIHITGDRYGTRSSTVVLMGRDGVIRFTEKAAGGLLQYEFQMSGC
ncbi:MAG TPA: NRDE family protein [Candidatus Xenobia bacterium]|jgi:uncharacterized protein with NRDE domain